MIRSPNDPIGYATFWLRMFGHCSRPPELERFLRFCTLETDSSPDVSVVQEEDALLLWWTDEKPSVSTA